MVSAVRKVYKRFLGQYYCIYGNTKFEGTVNPLPQNHIPSTSNFVKCFRNGKKMVRKRVGKKMPGSCNDPAGIFQAPGQLSSQGVASMTTVDLRLEVSSNIPRS